ncbi:amidohydrolase family protein [Achromobacter aloeverae]
MTAPVCLPFDPAPKQPRWTPPAWATDCHCHIFEDFARYPLNPERSYTPVAAGLEDYLGMCKTLGLSRTVQVTASVYGTDNSLTLAVISELGQHRARGVAGIAIDTSWLELERLHAGGMRGVRLSSRRKGYGGVEAIAPLARLIHPFGWHLQLHVADIAEFVGMERLLLHVPVPIVFDHLGCARGGDRLDAPGFRSLLRVLQRRDDAWCKLSSWYRRSNAGPPDYPDMEPFVEALADARPDRLVFGTNWPHPGLFEPDTVPNDGTIMDQFCKWVPDADVRTRILVDNPELLYGFSAS